MIDADRMVRTLAEAIQYPHSPARLGGSREDRVGKRDLVHNLRATESEYQPTRSHLGYGGGIETLVSTKCVLEHPAMFGKCRWIDYDEVILSGLALAEKFDGIPAMILVWAVSGIDLHIALHQGHRLGR